MSVPLALNHPKHLKSNEVIPRLKSKPVQAAAKADVACVLSRTVMCMNIFNHREALDDYLSSASQRHQIYYKPLAFTPKSSSLIVKLFVQPPATFTNSDVELWQIIKLTLGPGYSALCVGFSCLLSNLLAFTVLQFHKGTCRSPHTCSLEIWGYLWVGIWPLAVVSNSGQSTGSHYLSKNIDTWGQIWHQCQWGFLSDIV